MTLYKIIDTRRNNFHRKKQRDYLEVTVLLERVNMREMVLEPVYHHSKYYEPYYDKVYHILKCNDLYDDLEYFKYYLRKVAPEYYSKLRVHLIKQLLNENIWIDYVS